MVLFRALGAVALATVLLSSAVSSAGASTRSYLTVEGDVFDHLGEPLAGIWVYCTGTNRAGVLTDATGRYHLEIPGATLEELERTPLRIRIQAQRKGWRFALASGEPELGLEMRVTKLESRLARLRVRSNDSSAVQAVASSVVLEANPRALLEATFVGSRGAQYETPPASLTIADEVTLAGDVPSIPELAPGQRIPAGGAETDRLASASRGGEPAPPPSTPPSLVSTNTLPGGVSPSAGPLGPRSGASSGSVAEPPPARNAVRPAAGKSSAPAVSTSDPSPAPAKVGSTGSAAAPAPAVAPVAPPRAPTPPPERESRGKPKKWNAAGDPEVRDAKPRLVRPGDETAVPAPHAARLSDGVSPGTTNKARPPEAATPSRPSNDTTPVRRSTREDHAGNGFKIVVVRDAPASGVGAKGPTEPSPVAMRSSGTTPPAGGSSLCDCTIRGTVEVRSERPLSERTEVVIGVENDPGAATSVELFMGSPRAFEIRPAPCGVHKLLLWTRSRQRFVLSSSEPRVVCTQGGLQQMRLELEPVARWGTTR